MSPGIYENLPAAEYHKLPYASSSRLRRLGKASPAHVRYEMDNPVEPTAAMQLGSAIHTRVLEPDQFEKLYIRSVYDNFLKKEARDWRDAAMANGVTVLSIESWAIVEAASRAVHHHPSARNLLARREQTELSLVWDDPETGVRCKARPDGLVKLGKGKALLDLKTTQSASREEFERSVYEFGYELQADHYLRGLAAHGIDASTAVIIAVETKPPHGVQVFRVEDEVLAAAHDEVTRLLFEWKRAEAEGWPGYPIDIQDIALPAWGMKRYGL